MVFQTNLRPFSRLKMCLILYYISYKGTGGRKIGIEPCTEFDIQCVLQIRERQKIFEIRSREIEKIPLSEKFPRKKVKKSKIAT